MTRDYRSTVFLPRTDFPMKAGLPEAEPRWLAKWAADGLEAQVRAARAGRERFILHDGPPYANGDIHIGHVLNKVLKDLVVRTQTLLGRDAPYIPGWDCHGLPIEWKVEEQYRAKKRSKDEVPLAEFRAECRAFAAKWVDTQRAQFRRLGVGGDWDDPYLTMDYASEAAIVRELLTFAESGQVYRGAKPVMWSPVERTALADAEVEYEDIVSTQIDVAFEIVDAPRAPTLAGKHIVVWTTTPWTIPVNQAIAYGSDIEYRTLRRISTSTVFPEVQEVDDRVYIIAAELIDDFIDRLTPGENSSWETGSLPTILLEGVMVRHPMRHLGGFFAKPRPLLAGEFVNTDQGTGLVHMAPDHGEDDFALCRANGIGPVYAVEPDGRYRADWGWLPGPGQRHRPQAERARRADLRGPARRRSAARGERGLPPQLSALVALEGQAHLPRDATVVHRDGRASCHAPSTACGGSPSPAPQGRRTLLLPCEAGEVAAKPTEGAGMARPCANSPSDAIERTRFVPEKGRNRLRSMVEGRPDWLISRQRAWGVPITLYVRRATGEYLRDPAVNDRIVAAVEAGGADAWFSADHAALLGPGYDAADYDPVSDILDVWFDSGSVHAILAPRLGDEPADLYLEGSDQHRGWFQSSLLEGCGTDRHAPFKGVLTHGFVLDPDGRKMSKSLGNTTDPLEIMKTSGADILRLWVATTDSADDVRVGKDILTQTGEAYRKLRNTLRYLLGALDGWSEAERLPVAEMPELERWVLHRLAELDAVLRAAVNDYDFNAYVTAIATFANADLSAFYFDIRKDSLYCDAPTSTKRRACRTVLDLLFGALTRWLAPVLVFTAEEAWTLRFPNAGSVHLLDWPRFGLGWLDEGLGAKWARLREVRTVITQATEQLRFEKRIGSSLEAEASLVVDGPVTREWVASEDFLEACIIAAIEPNVTMIPQTLSVNIRPTSNAKCARCWRHRPEVGTLANSDLCDRCFEVVGI